MNLKRFMAQAALAVIFTLLAGASVFAQCAMCKASIAGAENAAEASKIMNTAVLILLIPAVTIFSLFIGLVFKFRHSQGGEMYETKPEPKPRHRPRDRFKQWGRHARRGEEKLRGTS